MPTDFLATVPMLHVDDSVAAQRFYCDQLGFEEIFRFQPVPDNPNPAYLGVRRGNCHIHVSSFSGDGVPGGVAVIYVVGIDEYCKQIAERGVDLGEGPVDQSWGNRECYISDPFGNQLRLTEMRDSDASAG